MITVQLSSIDGETFVTFVTPDAEQALKFLEKEDHEGSSLSVTCRVDNEQAYHLLALMKDSKGMMQP